MPLNGKVAFITGAARGQGRSHAVALAKAGADIIAVDICAQTETVPYPLASPADLAQTVKEVEALDRRIVSAEVDIRNFDALKAAVDSAVAELGRLDIVVANAGISTPDRTLEMDVRTWEEMIDINLTGQWKTLKAAVPHILETGDGGSVVIISSVAVMNTSENTAHYTAAKAGLVGLMQVMAKELAARNIRVNTIHPGTVPTDMIINEATFRLFRPDLENPTREDFEVAMATLNRMPTAAVEVEDITNAVLYLVTDAGRFVTGTSMIIDAGGRFN